MANTVHINSEKLKQLREQRVLSQEGLEQACRQTQGCSISMATIKRAELGRPISRRSATRLANFFSIPLAELIASTSSQPSDSVPTASQSKKSIVLWFHTSHAQLLRTVTEKALHYEPYMFQRVGENIIVAFPYHPHSLCALIIQTTLLKLCHSFSNYRALLTLETLSQTTPCQWQMATQQLQKLGKTANQLPNRAIAVSQDLHQQSYNILHYQSCSPINGYQVLLQGQETVPDTSLNELAILQNNAFRFAQLYGSDTELIL